MLRVLYEDNHLIAVAKPAGLATMGARAGEPSLLEQAKEHVKQKYNKPGNVYLGVVSRLDKPVTGVVLFARTSKAAARLTEAFGSGGVDKRYLACVSGQATSEETTLVRKDDANQRMVASPRPSDDSQQAELRYRALSSTPETSLLEVKLLTGRKHQIRVQLAKEGLPILGDHKYGPGRGVTREIALHAWRLELKHPVRDEMVKLEAPPPDSWRKRYGSWAGDALDRLSE